MPARALSPAVSENDIDIAGALANDSDSEHDGHGRSTNRKDAPIRALDGGDNDEDDEEFIALTQAASNRKASNLKGRTVKKGGGFQVMGLNANLLKAITRKGFAVPTPIQRRTIPLLLAGKDVVGMARTGSGKTAAFVVPMVEKLKAHSAQVGARALILSPSRELALQTLKVVKELSRGTDLKAILLVGGDSLEEQFGAMAGNPDIVIATPGRFLHLQVEMRLDLSSIRYVVFDEADRLFEMGFATQLAEILAALPASRQTLLFSATLPKSLVEFAHAGLQDPSLVRLDVESKVSPDLQSAFFSVKSSEKEGALLHLLENVIQMPTGPTGASLHVKEEAKMAGKKRKRGEMHDVNADSPTPFSTLVFAATKHHVDYLAYLLRSAGYAASHVYGSLDQTARRQQVQDFRAGRTHVMVVTDVAARGIDIPILANVINYDFPAQPKVFVHRVGRTARAGKTGWSYSLVADADVPYMLDLQLFLGRRLIVGRSSGEEPSYAADVVAGSFGRDALERCIEGASKMVADDVDLSALRDVAAKGEKLYRRTRQSASAQSAQRAKTAVAGRAWSQLHPLFGGAEADLAALREQMLARVSGFRPQETVFEIGRNGQLSDAGEVVRKRRGGIVARKQKARGAVMEQADDKGNRTQSNAADESDSAGASFSYDELEAPTDLNGTSPPPDALSGFDDASDLEVTISQRPSGSTTARDPSVYMSYTPQSGSGDAYAVNSSNPSSFLTTARSLTLDLGADEGGKGFTEPSRAGHQTKRWDRKAKKYVNTEISTAENGMKRNVKKKGSDGATIVGESGARLSASFRSGRFDAWMKKQRLGRLPRVGEKEDAGVMNRTAGANLGGGPGHRFFHKQAKAPKTPDKKRDDFHKQKKRVEKAKTDRVGRFSEGEGKSEIKGFREVQKERMAKSKRREKNGPGKKSFKKKGRK